MFNIILYTNTSPRNYLNKTLTTISTVSGVLKDETSIVNPTIIIEYSGIPEEANYLYIAEFGRYYYIEDISSVRNGIIEIICSSDPLMSFNTDIKNCSGIIRRTQSASHYNMLIDDGSFRTYANPYIRTVKFPNGFTNATFLLAVAGGAGNSNTTNGEVV